mgnify:CR=1 FL=1
MSSFARCSVGALRRTLTNQGSRSGFKSLLEKSVVPRQAADAIRVRAAPLNRSISSAAAEATAPRRNVFGYWLGAAAAAAAGSLGLVLAQRQADAEEKANAPKIVPPANEVIEDAVLTFAPNVPPPITRKHPVTLRVKLRTEIVVAPLTNKCKSSSSFRCMHITLTE